MRRRNLPQDMHIKPVSVPTSAHNLAARRERGRLLPGLVLALVFSIPLCLQAQESGQPAQSNQPIPDTGLLPIYSVEMQINPAWVDGAGVPSTSESYANSGVNDIFQRTWEALSPAGFNIVRIPVDITSAQAPARLANLCIWAKANNVRLIPILRIAAKDPAGKPLAANAAANFVSQAVSLLRAAEGGQFAAYQQIVYFQLEDAINHRGMHPGIPAPQQLLQDASKALREAEVKALDGSGTQPTPVMAAASFDYELILQGGIAAIPLDPAAEQKALASLKQFLAPLAASTTIEAIDIEWFPGSLSAGDVDHFSTLLTELKTALPGKQLIMTSGFSTAFSSTDEQGQFFNALIAKLGGFRAQDGAATTPFLGVVLRQALQGPGADATLAGKDPGQWDWKAKARQLAQMWTQGGKSQELTWWLAKVQDNMGMLALQTDASGAANITALASLETLAQISATVGQAAQNPAPAEANAAEPSAAPEGTSTTPADPNATPDASQQNNESSTDSAYKQLLFGIVQQVTSQVANQLTANLTNKLAGAPQPDAPAGNSFTAPADPAETATNSGSPESPAAPPTPTETSPATPAPSSGANPPVVRTPRSPVVIVPVRPAVAHSPSTPAAPSRTAPSAPAGAAPSGTRAVVTRSPIASPAVAAAPGAATSPQVRTPAAAVAAAPVSPRPVPGATATPGAVLPARPSLVTANPSVPAATGGKNVRTLPSAPGTAMPARPAVAPVAPVAPQGHADLSVSGSDIRFNPSPAHAGQPATFFATVRNGGTAASQAATVVFRLVVDGQSRAVSSPMPISVAARGNAQANWTVTLPPGRQAQVIVAVSTNGDQNAANNQASVSFALASPPPAPPRPVLHPQKR